MYTGGYFFRGHSVDAELLSGMASLATISLFLRRNLHGENTQLVK